MTQFFADASQINTDEHRLVITGDDYNHIRNVLRMKPGEEFSVRCQGVPREYRCGILEFTDSEVICEIRFIKEDDTELPVKVTIYQALPKADKMETVIQKCVELGAVRIIPVRTSRCVVKLDDKKADAKCVRWQQIAEAAAKQSQRGIIPVVGPVMDLDEALEDASKLDVRLMPYELAGDMAATRKIISETPPGASTGVFIGPEGGFDESEVTRASEKGFAPITLGRRILRTETAAMTVMSWLVYLFDDKA
ncbi:MAG: 16S rRNA (uracil(1498)-N(3))-methyltransferase [Lachnospiraceae bacterium]|nr:16S rRNA (uracil(1498)-N(3))-methyltransferase [Lachnospiraceae bacterium]